MKILECFALVIGVVQFVCWMCGSFSRFFLGLFTCSTFGYWSLIYLISSQPDFDPIIANVAGVVVTCLLGLICLSSWIVAKFYFEPE